MLWILMGGSGSDKPIKLLPVPLPLPLPLLQTGLVSSPPPPGFLASSPHGQPYMWGVQQVKAKYISHIMPPCGAAPHPYVAMYPQGGIHAPPSIPPGSYPFSPFPML
ncbi:hypothetical protein MLD38_015536 [Melastoma candidum]|uniref:Uncharacterized protein n=1 Tax=Melastoma candidum TaxID=119954 RepID=A0ACB9RH12_9MYRT|nr:hypothetical protein MLD38_015536 [Melastoma candidum]